MAKDVDQSFLRRADSSGQRIRMGWIEASGDDNVEHTFLPGDSTFPHRRTAVMSFHKIIQHPDRSPRDHATG